MSDHVFVENFITEKEELELVSNIDKQPWVLITPSAKSRKVQHYGYTYEYAKPNLSMASPIPDWIKPIQTKLETLLKYKFDQVIINEYHPGQGISPHIDHTELFDDCVVSLSLLSDVDMDLTLGTVKETVRLFRRSIIILQNESRYIWKHSIPARLSDGNIQRNRRISLTFRKIKK